MSELKDLAMERVRINSRIWEINRKQRQEQNVKLIGKCYRYRNSFGNENKGWWLYIQVLELEDGNLIVHRFQTDSNGRIEVEPRRVEWDSVGSQYEEIPREDFWAAWDILKLTILSMK